MSIPNFNYNKKTGIWEAIDYIRETTEADSIDNKIIAGVYGGMMNTVFDDLSDIEKRKLLVAMETVKGGRFGIRNNFHPDAVITDQFRIEVRSKNAPPEILQFRRGGANHEEWFNGSPDYEAELLDDIEVDSSKLADKEYVILNGFDKQLIGHEFGNLKAGTILSGTGHKYFNTVPTGTVPFGLQRITFPTTMAENYIDVLIEDNTGLNFSFYSKLNYDGNQELKPGHNSAVFHGTLAPNFYLYCNQDIKLPEGKGMTILMLKDGNVYINMVHVSDNEFLKESSSVFIGNYPVSSIGDRIPPIRFLVLLTDI